jgi:hypothetical protein
VNLPPPESVNEVGRHLPPVPQSAFPKQTSEHWFVAVLQDWLTHWLSFVQWLPSAPLPAPGAHAAKTEGVLPPPLGWM